MSRKSLTAILLPADPTAPLEAATKQYVDGLAGGAHADTDHDDRFALIEHDTAHDDRFSLLAHTHAAHADSDHDDRFSLLAHNHDGSYATPAHIHAPGAWQTMTGLASPWANGSVSPRFRFEDAGYTVRLSGAVTRPSGSNALIYTFAANYRPDRGHNFAVSATSAFGRLTVTTAGLLQLNAGVATGDVFLDGVTFAVV